MPLLQQPALAGPAAIALGRIGGEAAASALGSAYGGATGALKVDHRRRAARSRVRVRAGSQKLPIYERLASDTVAAGAATTGGDVRAHHVVGHAAGGDRACWPARTRLAQEAAIARVSFAFFPDAIGKVCATLPGLPDATKVQLIAALAGYPHAQVASAVTNELRSQTPAVRMAAFKTLGTIGGPAAVQPLAEAAAGSKGAEQTAARAAIGSLKGRAVDEAIVAQLAKKPADAVAGELLLAVGDRRIFPAKPVVIGGAVFAVAGHPRAGPQGAARHRHALRHAGGPRRAAGRERGVRPD